MLRALLSISLALLILIGLSSTGGSAPRADFTFINGAGDINTLDPQRMSWQNDLRVARMFYEGLVRNNVMTWGYDIEPAAASSWTVSDDGRTYTFTIADDARWSNGEPVLASDFVYSWRRAMLPDTAADYTKLFQTVEGATEFYEWRADALDSYAKRPASERTPAAAAELWRETERRFDDTVRLHAPDERTLTMTLVRPTPYWLDLCAFSVFAPVYPPLVTRYERLSGASGRLDTGSGWTKAGVMVSNGAYMLEDWRFKRAMRAAANPHHRGFDDIAVRTVNMPVYDDANAMVLAYRTGAVDWVTDVTVGYRADIYAQKREFLAEHADTVATLQARGYDQFEIDRRLPDDPRKDIHVFPMFATYWYNFNCLERLPDGRPNPFHDPRVRRAFSMCIDKESIVRDIKRTGEPAAPTIIPPGSIGGYDSPAGLGFDPAGARALLAEAGWSDPSKMPVIEILFNKDSGHDLIAQAVAKDWQEHLGVSVSLDQKELKVYRNDLKNANYMVSRAGWIADYGDPTTFLEVNRTGDGNNDRKYSNPRYDELLNQAQTETDPSARMAILSEAERILVEEDLPLVPIYHYVNVYLFDADHVTGFNCQPRAMQNVFLFDVFGDGLGPDTPRGMPLVPRGPLLDPDLSPEGDAG